MHAKQHCVCSLMLSMSISFTGVQCSRIKDLEFPHFLVLCISLSLSQGTCYEGHLHTCSVLPFFSHSIYHIIGVSNHCARNSSRRTPQSQCISVYLSACSNKKLHACLFRGRFYNELTWRY